MPAESSRLRRVVAAGLSTGVSLPLAAAAVVIHLRPPIALLLQYDRAAVDSGEFWRLLTGHWTHWSADHLFWDVLAFTLLAGLCEVMGRWRMVACTLVAAAAIGAAVELGVPGIHVYRGLSGIDSALFTLAVVTLLRRAILTHRRMRTIGLLICLAAFLLKTIFECGTGATLFVDSAAAGMTPVPLVHIIGAVIGLVVGGWRPRPGADGRRRTGGAVNRRPRAVLAAARSSPAAPTPPRRAPIARTPR